MKSLIASISHSLSVTDTKPDMPVNGQIEVHIYIYIYIYTNPECTHEKSSILLFSSNLVVNEARETVQRETVQNVWTQLRPCYL